MSSMEYHTVQQTEANRVEGGDQGVNSQEPKNSVPPTPITPKTSNERTDITPFVGYGLALLFVFFASLGFWVQSRRKPIFFSIKDTARMFANPKTTTILWTAVASIIAWFTLWLYSCAVSLMARKLIIKGAKISTIESGKGWVKLSSHGTMFDKRRPFLSLYTALSALVTAALTVGFAGLLTPVPIVKSNILFGTELDMTKSGFFDWYADTKNRTYTGCNWWPYTGSRGSYTFATCPFNDDTSLVLQAGRAAEEQGHGLKAVTKIGDVNFNGTTGGTLPIGRNGFKAFDNLNYTLDGSEFPPIYNYSTLLQGSTVHVTCEQNSTSPITQEVLGVIPTIKSSGVSPGPKNYRNYTHVRYNFNKSLTYGRCPYDYYHEFVVPVGGNLMSFQCPSMISNGPGYYIFFRPFGDYVDSEYRKLQNLTCKIEPRVTINNVTYSSVTDDFTSRVIETFDTPGMSPTDSEAIDAIFQVFWFGISIERNIIADSILSLRHQNGGNRQTIAQSFENIIKGFYEIEMTSLRLYYSANHAPGSRNITGNLAHFRMGYSGVKEALYALVPLAIVVCMALTYLVWGLRAGGQLFQFNPTRTTSLLVASSQGGLDLGERITATSVKYPDEGSVQDVKIKFGELSHGVLGLTLDEGYTVQSPRLGGPRSCA